MFKINKLLKLDSVNRATFNDSVLFRQSDGVVAERGFDEVKQEIIKDIATTSAFVELETYDELYNLLVAGELVKDAVYRFPYNSVNFVHGQRVAEQFTISPNNFANQSAEFIASADAVHTGETEWFYAKAISTFELSKFVTSEKFTQDVIEFMPYVNSLGCSMSASNGQTMRDNSVVTGFDLQWDSVSSRAYFDMSAGYPINYGHILYLYAEFEEVIPAPPSGVPIFLMSEPVVTLPSFTTETLGGFTGMNAPIFKINQDSLGPGEQEVQFTTNGNGKDFRGTIYVFGSPLQLQIMSIYDTEASFSYIGNGYAVGDEVYFTYDGENYTYILQADDVSNNTAVWTNIPLTGGSGSGATANVQLTLYQAQAVNGKSDSFLRAALSQGGQLYQAGDIVKIQGTSIGLSSPANDVSFEVVDESAISPPQTNYYYQDGAFEPLKPGINTANYPYTSDAIEIDYPKQMSRAQVSEDMTRVWLLDLTEQDVLNYVPDSLFVEHIEKLVDCYGYITRRRDTERNISAPLDWRNFKYRRWYYDLSDIPGMHAGYFGITSLDNILEFSLPAASTEWRDFTVFSQNSSTLNVYVGGVGGPTDVLWYGDTSRNFVFADNVIFAKFESLQDMTIHSYITDITCLAKLTHMYLPQSSIANVTFINGRHEEYYYYNRTYRSLPHSHANKELIFNDYGQLYTRTILGDGSTVNSLVTNA